MVRACTVSLALTANELSKEAEDAPPSTSATCHVAPPSVLHRHWAAVCAEPSMGLWRHATVMLACVFGMTCELDGDVIVGAAGAQMVTMPSDSTHALARSPHTLRTR